MRLEKVMVPWEGAEEYCQGIDQKEDLYLLTDKQVQGFGPIVPIIDERGRKVGELDKQMILRLLDMELRPLFYRILDELHAGVIVKDASGTVVYANELSANILGFRAGGIIGEHLPQVPLSDIMAKALQQQEHITIERTYIAATKKYVSGRVEAVFLHEKLLGIVAIFRDDTLLEELTMKVERANQVASNLRQQIRGQKLISDMKIIGSATIFRKMLSQASVVADTDVPVLIRGENGSGKEVVARYIHARSHRAEKPFVVVNCAAMPENLVESELFGYEGGSFTGAKEKGKIGKFEMADGGTLFLDEIGDMPVSMQPKLLRAIQENEIEKVGREKTISVDVRIITATNQPLEQLMAEKKFRVDLYYRINTVCITVPPLRERSEDVGLLAILFLEHFSEKYHKKLSFSNEAMDFVYKYTWPGNVRELKNFIENSVIMCQGSSIDQRSVAEYMEGIRGNEDRGQKQVETEAMDFGHSVAQAEKSAIEAALKANDNNKTAAMSALGLSRRTFYRKLQKYGIK